MAEAAAVRTRFPRIWIAVAGVVAALVAGTLGLWAHYGTAVFYQMILSGLAACF